MKGYIMSPRRRTCSFCHQYFIPTVKRQQYCGKCDKERERLTRKVRKIWCDYPETVKVSAERW